MRARYGRPAGWAALLAALTGLAGCEAASAGDVQPLPPLKRPSQEAQAGLPEVAGTWRFTGFEIAPEDTARINADSSVLVRPGDVVFRVQRLDSLAGSYVQDSVSYPFTGELRRDGTVAVVANMPDGVGLFLAGHLQRDTLWVELTSFPFAAAWPRGARAALVRTPVRSVFRRFLGGRVIPPPVDTAALRDSLRADSLAAAVRDAAARAQAPAGAPPSAAPPPARTQAPAGPPTPAPTRPARPAPEPPVTGEEPPARPQPRPVEPRPVPVPEPVTLPPSRPSPVPVPVEPVPSPTLPVPDPIPPPRPAPAETIRFPAPRGQ